MMLLSILVLTCCWTLGSSQNLAGLSRSAATIFDRSVVPGRFVRQCNCNEQAMCVNTMQYQGKSCSDRCFNVFRMITNRPDQLQRCVQMTFPQLNGFISCVTRNMGRTQFSWKIKAIGL
ncbi:unnamed protein product [Caenorhabditis auriculariae]|uniref:Uncharacterized protein n=1 Tax=Caenorhabditis auriculariae TaxID=2777116 RepID=A0A8S1HP17_9PELO|nr:unnamed protein product [Caenorhabditis auriculariae]